MTTGKDRPRNPYLAVDAIVEKNGGILVVKRKNPPRGWALPGGFVEYGESVETAVERELMEETGIRLVDYQQWRVFSDPDRDPRKHVVSVCFVGKGRGEPEAATDAAEVSLWKPSSEDRNLVFDHGDILRKYLAEFS